jgi:xylan 1,4-beta-xylosidase
VTARPNPLIAGFNPDPSVVLVDGVYHLVTSSFEYLPGLPVYRSTDLVEWTHVGNVATRPEQVQVEGVVTGCGVWAPTIRHRNGVYFVIVIVTVAMSPRGCVVFTATDPAGPWSDGTTIDGIDGIDPDLAWDDDGTAYVTYSGLGTTGEDLEAHHGIQQVRVDLAAGRALEPPRSLWSGTGAMFPEAPHLHRRGDWWYLVIAEGGTERGHAVSVARSHSPQGPFEPCPANPVLTARGTRCPIQNTGHADLVDTPDGGSALVLLGVRPLGLTRAFSPLGRETFATDVAWVDDWPFPAPVELAPRPGVDEEVFDFSDPAALADPGWLGVRRTPDEVASTTESPGRLALTGDGSTLGSTRPCFLGRRQRHLTAAVSTRIDASRGVGGLAARYSEAQHVELEARCDGTTTTVTGRAVVTGLTQSWSHTFPAGEVSLRMDMTPPPTGFTPEALGGDRIRLVAFSGEETAELAELDGRHWSAEAAVSFTGRVLGLYAVEGTVTFAELRYTGCEE